MPEWKQYHRAAGAEMRPVRSNETLASLCAAGVSVSQADSRDGSPKPGDMIARNPITNAAQWLVAAEYFAENFEPVDPPMPDRTHHPECWRDPAHHACAVREVERLREATTRTEGILAAIPKEGQMTIHVKELNRLIGHAWLDGVARERRAPERVEEEGDG